MLLALRRDPRKSHRSLHRKTHVILIGGSKALQHWLWYAYNTKTGGVLAYTFGPRTDETCRELLALLTPFNIGMITSDNWGSYAREVPKQSNDSN
ncbi:hypothetical protein CE195_03035 [Sodalis-like symbiont of Philaenus spumarius]|nr:hypothetical protein CE195_03035 [Sodalis-like symbiont of Philaenus spumarius]